MVNFKSIADGYNNFTVDEIVELLNVQGKEQEKLFDLADRKTKQYFGNLINIRGVIELSNICNNNCKYCSMGKQNHTLKRYYICYKEFVKIVDEAYDLGIRVFHLSSGENDCYSDEILMKMVQYIINKECRVILVIGNKKKKFMKKIFITNKMTVICKFETSNSWLYSEYNDKSGNLDFRIEYLKFLRDIGYKIGTGNIVGLPHQNDYILAHDLLLLQKINPEQASTSRFIHNQYSFYSDQKDGNIKKTLNYIALMRLMLDGNTIIPTNSSVGKEDKYKALFFGANLISINLTPEKYYKQYVIYNDQTRYRANLKDVEDKLKNMGLKLNYLF